MPAWAKKYPIPENWVPLPKTIEHVEDAEMYVASVPYLKSGLGTGWKMPAIQQWFWEREYLRAQDENRVDKYLKDMAATDEECFANDEDVDLDNLFPDAAQTQKLVFKT
jgi:hypothetical protein